MVRSLNIKNKRSIVKIVLTTLSLILFTFLLWFYFQLGAFRQIAFSLPTTVLFSKQYLVLLQNNYELRPTGGFISAYARVKFLFGFPYRLEIGDSYNIDHTNPEIVKETTYIEAPEKITELLNHPTFKGWTFRDSNFDPDFIESAKQAVYFYNLVYPDTEFDGIIAINLSFFEDLFNITGPIEIDDYTLDRANFFSILQFESKNIDLHNAEAIKTRKNFMKEFYNKGMKQIGLSPMLWKDFFDFIANQFNKKNIIAYMPYSASINKFLHTNNWDGGMNYREGDNYLALVGGNYGGRKSDRYISRNISHYIYHPFSGNTITNKVTLDLLHNGDIAYLSHVYIGYYRFFIPANATNIRNLNIDNITNFEVGQYNDKLNYVGITFTLNPQSKYNWSFSYELPIIDNNYNITYRKQPGVNNETYNLYIHTPLELQISSNDITAYENTAIYKNIIEQDIHISYSLQTNKTPLMITYQDFNTDSKRIEIRYDRIVDKNNATNISNYTIVDKNINNPNISDQNIIIKDIEYHEDFIYLWVDNVSNQPEEHFSITIKNQKDRLDNHTSPKTRDITVVMRAK